MIIWLRTIAACCLLISLTTACSPNPAGSTSPPAETQSIRADSSASPTAAQAAAEPAATLPSTTPSATASPTEPPTATTPSVAPTVAFGDCDVLSRAQAESILGPLAYDPTPLEWIGPGGLRSGVCDFSGDLNTADVSNAWYAQAADARAFYQQQPGNEAVEGVGDEARWDSSGLALAALRDRIVLVIHMGPSDHAREQAIQIGQIALVRIP